MKLIRTGMAAAMAVGLLAGSTAVAVAQDADEERVAPVMFKIRDVGNPNGGDDVPGAWTEFDWGMTINGAVRPDRKLKAGDPRASGFLTIVANEDLYSDSKGGPIVVGATSQRLVNADGAWAGTGTELLDFTEMVDGEPPKRKFGSWTELAGEGAYEGLTLIMFQDHNSWHGVIMPTGQVPPVPEPASAE